MSIRIDHVSKRFGGFRALKDVCVTIPESAINLLMGPNGSGKTTLLNCISGVFLYSGEIWFNDTFITGKKPWEIVKLGIGRSFQIPAPFKHLTVAENLLVCSQNHKGENFLTSILKSTWDNQEKELVQKLFKILKIVDLVDQCDTLANELSGGQLKLLELGRLLMLDSKLMLLDEPIGGVNPVLAHKILSQIQKIRDNFGTTCLLIEHRIDIVMQYVDYVHVIAEGRIACEDTPKKIVNRKEFYEIYT